MFPVFEQWLRGERPAALTGLAALEQGLSDRVGRERDAYVTAIGFAYLAFGRADLAERVFWSAAAPARQLNLAALALTAGDEPRARDWLSQITEHAAVRPALFARMGFEEEAERAVASMLPDGYGDAIAAVTRGLIAMRRGDSERATAALRRGADLLRFSGEPEFFLAAEALAGIARQRNDMPRSVRWLMQAGDARAQTYSASHWTAAYWIALSRQLQETHRGSGRPADAARIAADLQRVLDAAALTGPSNVRR